MSEDGRLLVAVPSKGRMAPPALELLAAAGLRFEAGERALHVPSQNAPVDLLLVRPHDIPEYVQDGVVHAGITGANLVVEAQADVVQLAELGFARCTLEAAVPNGAPQQALADLAGLRVATAYPVTTRIALAETRGRGRARHDFRLGRGRATARALGRRGRPRLDRLDGERERSPADRAPALVGGGADREPRRAGRRHDASCSNGSS